MNVTPGQREALAVIAEAWGVPPSTAAWAILADTLERAARSLLPLPVAVARRILAKAVACDPNQDQELEGH